MHISIEDDPDRSFTPLDTVEVVKNAAEASDLAARIVRPGDTVLVKASRAARLERVVEAIQNYFGSAATMSPQRAAA